MSEPKGDGGGVVTSTGRTSEASPGLRDASAARWAARFVRLAAVVATALVVFVSGVAVLRALPLDRHIGMGVEFPRGPGDARPSTVTLTVDAGVSARLVRRPAGEPVVVEAEYRFLLSAPSIMADSFGDDATGHGVLIWGGCQRGTVAQWVDPCRMWVRVTVPDGVRVTAVLKPGNHGLTADDGVAVEKTVVP